MCVFGYLHCQGYLFHGFHLLEPLPLRNARGFSLPPKHSTEKFFRKFFQHYPRLLFADFLARICDEGKGCLPIAIGGGGCPFLCGLVGLSLPFFRCVSSFLVGFRSLLANSIGSSWSCCDPCFVGWCVASLPRSCSDSLGSIRTTDNRCKTAQNRLKRGKT